MKKIGASRRRRQAVSGLLAGDAAAEVHVNNNNSIDFLKATDFADELEQGLHPTFNRYTLHINSADSERKEHNNDSSNSESDSNSDEDTLLVTSLDQAIGRNSAYSNKNYTLPETVMNNRYLADQLPSSRDSKSKGSIQYLGTAGSVLAQAELEQFRLQEQGKFSLKQELCKLFELQWDKYMQ